MRRRCLIVDDSEPFLSSAAALLSSQGMTVVGCASSAAEALRMSEELKPTVVLVDIELGDEDGIDLARRLVSRDPVLPVVLVSALPLTNTAELVSDAGADGFLAKTALSAQAIDAVCERRGR